MPTTVPVSVPACVSVEQHRKHRRMDANNPTFQEFRAYWQLSEELIADAAKVGILAIVSGVGGVDTDETVQ